MKNKIIVFVLFVLLMGISSCIVTRQHSSNHVRTQTSAPAYKPAKHHKTSPSKNKKVPIDQVRRQSRTNPSKTKPATQKPSTQKPATQRPSTANPSFQQPASNNVKVDNSIKNTSTRTQTPNRTSNKSNATTTNRPRGNSNKSNLR